MTGRGRLLGAWLLELQESGSGKGDVGRHGRRLNLRPRRMQDRRGGIAVLAECHGAFAEAEAVLLGAALAVTALRLPGRTKNTSAAATLPAVGHNMNGEGGGCGAWQSRRLLRRWAAACDDGSAQLGCRQPRPAAATASSRGQPWSAAAAAACRGLQQRSCGQQQPWPAAVARAAARVCGSQPRSAAASGRHVQPGRRPVAARPGWRRSAAVGSVHTLGKH